jgi:hypothetical protein
MPQRKPVYNITAGITGQGLKLRGKGRGFSLHKASKSGNDFFTRPGPKTKPATRKSQEPASVPDDAHHGPSRPIAAEPLCLGFDRNPALIHGARPITFAPKTTRHNPTPIHMPLFLPQ